MICRLKKGLLGFIILPLSITCYAQQNTPALVDSVAEIFLNKVHSNTKEQIFVHTDKWFYVAGETIWFKAYCLGYLSHRLSRYSKTMMVDFVNDKDKVISHLLLNNQRLLTSGDIQLPINLPEGDYWLRAYTARMLREDVNQIYVKHIYVFNGGKKPVLDLPADDSPRVSFFPEGGSIIEATDQKIAVGIKDAAGNPLQVSGYITDEDDTARAKFTTSNTGVGIFHLYMQPGDYKVHIKSANGNNFTYPLPSSSPGSASLSILSKTDSTLHVLVSLGDSLFKADATTVLLGMNRDKLCFAAGGHGLYELDIPKKNFPGGENRLLLFNQRHEVISERPFYLDRKNIIVNIQPIKDNFGDREKAKLDISFTDENDKPVIAWFSISIDDDNQVTQPLEKDESAFLPSDDSKHSAQYTADEKELAVLASRPQFMGGKSSIPRSASIEEFQGIKGIIANHAGAPQQNKVVTLLGEGDEKMPVYGVDTTKQKGQFSFMLPNYIEGTQFQLDVTNLKGIQENQVILMDSFHFPRFSTPENLKLKFYGAASRLPYFKTYNFDTSSFGKGRQWLNAVTVKGKKKAAIFPEDDKRLSRFSHLIYPETFSPGMNNISSAIITAPGVSIVYGHLNIGGRSSMGGKSDGEPLLIVDGAPIDFADNSASSPIKDPSGFSDAVLQYIDRNLDKSSIQFIEILSGPEAAIYGLRGGNGVISVVTSAYSRSAHANAESGLQKIQTNGYHKSNPFPAPDYNKEEELKKNPGMDQRATLYWNGDILTNEEGKATVTFFTSDQPSTYTATLQGITLRGDVVYKRISIQRK